MNKKVLGIAAQRQHGGARFTRQEAWCILGTAQEGIRNYGGKQVCGRRPIMVRDLRDANFDGHNIHILESMDVGRLKPAAVGQ